MEAQWTIIWCVLSTAGLILLAGPTRAQLNTCPVFGNDQSTSESRSREERIFLNFEAPSQCKGNVTSWSFCHYDSRLGGDDDDDDDDDDDSDDDNNRARYAAKFMIYRRQSPTSDNYDVIQESITTKELLHRAVSRFTCLNQPVPQRFEIRENDIVGACIMDDGPINPLYLIGDTNDPINQRLYQLDRSGYDDCRSSQIASVDTGHSSFRRRREFILHLYANIATDDAFSCRAGNNPAATTPHTITSGGTYLNTGSPATCTNSITKWSYCYYTAAATPGQIYTMIAAVWRLDSDSNTYQVIEGSNRTITLNPVATKAKVFCKEESLESTGYVSVMRDDDIIGVVLPSSNPIPVIGSNAGSGSSLMRHSQSLTAMDLPSSEFAGLTGTTLHLYSNLEYVSVPATLPMTTEPPTTVPPMTTEPPTTVPPMTTEPPTTLAETTPTMDTEIGTTSEPTDLTTNALVNATDTADATTPRDLDRTSASNTMTTGSSDSGTNNTPTLGNGNVFDGSQADPGLSSGDVAAIIMSLLVVIVLVVSVAVIILLYRQHRRKFSALGGIDNVTYDADNQVAQINPMFSKFAEDDYESISGEYLTPVEQDKRMEADDIYHEIEENGNAYYSPVDHLQDYHERLEEAKKGSASTAREMPYHNPANTETDIYSQLKKLKIRNVPGFSIEIGEELGSGQFGTVHQGTWSQKPNLSVDVAIKTLNNDASMIDRVRFLQEAAIMAQFKHPNVVALYGVAKKNEKQMIVVELLSKGDLRSYLKSLQPDPGEMVESATPQLLLEFSQQIALGMSYLSDRGFVHRDLAARNILIADSNICKIADFGMSRDLQDTDYYVSSGGKIPLKWTAPEAIHYKRYSTASDVWSFGCVLYEIWSLGTKPFEGKSNLEVLRHIEDGRRLSPPPGCPKRVYELMMLSWSKESSHRPEFRDMLLSLLENKDIVLNIPSEDLASHPLAGILGSVLEAGEGMYTDIQNTYKS